MIVILMGVSGSGKTTVGELLSAVTGLPFYDGDDFHPSANIQKMSSGTPLTDTDRIGWIDAIAEHLNSKPDGSAILACSALSKVIRQRLVDKLRQPCRFVFLHGSKELISKRLQSREGHFMKEDMLHSQFEALQIPDDKTLSIDIEKSPEEITQKILTAIQF
ncbi:MAG: gluconokinase [Calditrichia bacterium]